MNNHVFMEQLNKYYAVWQECNYVYEQWAKVNGLSINGLLVLSAIYEGGEDCTQKKISQRWMIPKQTTNMVLKEFDRKGFVRLLPMEKDRRNKYICFTDEGKEYADEIISNLRKVELAVIEKMGIEKMVQMNKNMELYVKLFGKIGRKQGDETNL